MRVEVAALVTFNNGDFIQLHIRNVVCVCVVCVVWMIGIVHGVNIKIRFVFMVEVILLASAIITLRW